MIHKTHIQLSVAILLCEKITEHSSYTFWHSLTTAIGVYYISWVGNMSSGIFQYKVMTGYSQTIGSVCVSVCVSFSTLQTIVFVSKSSTPLHLSLWSWLEAYSFFGKMGWKVWPQEVKVKKLLNALYHQSQSR